jgi:hypothetical protein
MSKWNHPYEQRRKANAKRIVKEAVEIQKRAEKLSPSKMRRAGMRVKKQMDYAVKHGKAGAATSIGRLSEQMLRNYQKAASKEDVRRKTIDVISAFGGEQCLRMLAGVAKSTPYPSKQIVYQPVGKTFRDFSRIKAKPGVDMHYAEKQKFCHLVPEKTKKPLAKESDLKRSQSEVKKEKEVIPKKARKSPSTLRREIRRKEARNRDLSDQLGKVKKLAETLVKSPRKEEKKREETVPDILRWSKEFYACMDYSLKPFPKGDQVKMREYVDKGRELVKFLEPLTPKSIRAKMLELGYSEMRYEQEMLRLRQMLGPMIKALPKLFP